MITYILSIILIDQHIVSSYVSTYILFHILRKDHKLNVVTLFAWQECTPLSTYSWFSLFHIHIKYLKVTQ